MGLLGAAPGARGRRRLPLRVELLAIGGSAKNAKKEFKAVLKFLKSKQQEKTL